MVNPTLGELYSDGRFSDFRNTYHPFLICSTDQSGNPTVTYQPTGTSTIVQACVIADSNPSIGYVVQESPGAYRMIYYVNVSTDCLVYMDAGFRAWLSTHYETGQQLSMLIGGTTYQHVLIAAKPGVDWSAHEYQFVYSSNSRNWNDPDSTDTASVAQWLAEAPDYHVTFSQEQDPAWMTVGFRNDIRAAHGAGPLVDSTPIVVDDRVVVDSVTAEPATVRRVGLLGLSSYLVVHDNGRKRAFFGNQMDRVTKT